MSPTRKALLLAAFAMPLLCASPMIHADETAALYLQHCAQCHGADRLGLMGPALLPATSRMVAVATKSVLSAVGLNLTST